MANPMSDERSRNIAIIRACFVSFGMPLDDLSDEEVEEGVKYFTAVARASGVTVAQATESFAALGHALTDSPGPSPRS